MDKVVSPLVTGEMRFRAGETYQVIQIASDLGVSDQITKPMFIPPWQSISNAKCKAVSSPPVDHKAEEVEESKSVQLWICLELGEDKASRARGIMSPGLFSALAWTLCLVTCWYPCPLGQGIWPFLSQQTWRWRCTVQQGLQQETPEHRATVFLGLFECVLGK